MTKLRALDLFSAAAGGWSLGLHRAGFETMAACEAVDWRRALYAQNNPGVKIYDDVCTLTAGHILRDFGCLPDIVVGSPPCQDISPANTKGRGVEGERSGLFFEAVRIIGECRPRWFALENSHNLRTKGADAVIDALEGLGYTCWPFVVRASNIGANHERPRAWLIGCDLAQVTDADGDGRDARWSGRRVGSDIPVSNDNLDAAGIRHEGGRPRRYGPDGDCAAHAKHSTADAEEVGRVARSGDDEGPRGEDNGREFADVPASGSSAVRECDRQVGLCEGDSGGSDGTWPLWSLDDLAARIRMDDGLPARVAGTRVAVGGPRGTVAASLIVEAYGDAVVPQIPEAIGRAILRVERALSAVAA